MDTMDKKYLAYDPTISPHYQVFSFPYFLPNSHRHHDPAVQESEWPPSPYALHVYSSVTGCWEERSFVREGEPAGSTVADMRHSACDQHNAVYWRGALYLHCQNDSVMRISLSENKYQIIKPPRGLVTEPCHYAQFYLGKSEKGVYCASTANRRCRVRVWILNKSPSDKMEWVLMHDSNLIEWLFTNKLDESRTSRRKAKFLGPWILDDVNSYYEKLRNRVFAEERSGRIQEASERGKLARKTGNEDIMYDSDDSMAGENSRVISADLVDEKFEWSWDCDDDQLNGECYSGSLQILGFHPYKEIVFLSESITRGLAYHLKSSKVQVLGNLYPAKYHQELSNEQLIWSSFIYTPCWLGDKGSAE